MNQKKLSFANTKNTSDVPTSASGAIGTTGSIMIFLFGLLLGFLFVWSIYWYCSRRTMAAISYGKLSQGSNNMRQEQENIEVLGGNYTRQEQENNEVFSQKLTVQNNSPDATSDRPASPRPTNLGISRAAFLPYPNTGIAYQAPSTNPV